MKRLHNLLILFILSGTAVFLTAEKKLEWDRPVSDYLPEFRLMDEYASLHATPRDLASHCSGLPRHDLVWVNSSLDLPGLVRSLRFLEPSRELRGQRLVFRTEERGQVVAVATKLEPAVKEIIFERTPQPKQP